MKQKTRITCTITTVLAMICASAQANPNASAAESTKNLLSTNSVESCANGASASLSEAGAMKALRVAADGGDVKAQFEMGRHYEYGNVVGRNAEEAVKWYRKAAEQGHADAQYTIGWCYRRGDNTEAEKWFRQALEQYRKAAEQGNVDAQYKLGECYLYGCGVVHNDAEALKWYQNAADQGDVNAQAKLGRLHSHVPHVFSGDVLEPRSLREENAFEAAKWLRKAAEQGHADSQYKIGYCYANGYGVEKNDAKAVEWYRKAAEQEDVDAQFCLADCYRNGRGVEHNDAEAVKWYRKVAERGQGHRYDDVQITLGDCYRYGKGVDKDGVEAVKWYRKASIGGGHQQVEEPRSLGISVNQNGKIAINVLTGIEYSSPYTNSVAVLRLADCYEDGIGVEKDAVEAVRLVQIVANGEGRMNGTKEKKEAMLRLANFHTNGVGMEKSLLAATKWRIKAWWEYHSIRTWLLRHEDGVVLGVALIFMIILIGHFLWRFALCVKGHVKLRKRANSGDADAMLQVAHYYSSWFFLRKKAMSWYCKAAEQYRKNAPQIKLDNCYRHIYIEYSIRDAVDAVKWYRKAGQGDREAQFTLGECYANGKGMEKDTAEAAKWYRLAALQGDERAVEKLKEMDSKD